MGIAQSTGIVDVQDQASDFVDDGVRDSVHASRSNWNATRPSCSLAGWVAGDRTSLNLTHYDAEG